MIFNKITQNKKLKKIIISSLISITLFLSLSIAALSILGSIKRTAYITEFDLLETNYNDNTTNYIYHFKIGYYDKIFKHSDIYGVYPDLSNLPDYIKEIKMDEAGSPFGNLISTKIINEEKIDNIRYTLKLKSLVNKIAANIIVVLLLIISLTLYIKFNISEYFDNKFNDKFCIIFLLLFVFIIMFFSLKLYNFKFGLPLRYAYGDKIQFFTQEAMIFNEGWFPVKSDRLGAPFGSYLGVYPSYLLLNFDILINKIISLFARDPIDMGSIFYFLIFPLTAISSFFVFRTLKMSKFISIFGSLIFAFIPFVFMRNIAHYVVSSIYFIPISILLCIWLYESDNLFMPTKNIKEFIKNKKNIMAIIFIILISNNGIAYYPFFTCYLIIITCVSKLLKTRNIKTILPFVISISLICILLFIVNFIPMFIYKSNRLFVDSMRRAFWETENAGLKISHLILNPKYFIEYYSQAMLVNENRTSYLGIVGVCGFIFLILYIFIKNYRKPLINDFNNRISLLSELNLFAVLLATIGGFASLFSYFISPMIRSYNRISVYIAFICILAFCMLVDNFIKKKNIIILSIILIIVLYEQIPNPNFYNDKQMQMYIQDKEFIENIESVMPTNSSIYQLPTAPSIDVHPPVNGNTFFRLFIGYIFSKDLKWSCGADYGRNENEWYEKVNNMGVDDLLNELSYSGFNGLYIDKKLFENEELANKIEYDLKNILKREPIMHENGSVLFFNLEGFEFDKNYIPIINDYK